MHMGYSIRSTIAVSFFLAVGLFCAVKPAQASAVQVMLNNLTFDSSSGSEVFNGSFLVDLATDQVIPSSLNILATGATDSSLFDQPLAFFGVDPTGFEPSQFAFDDGQNDFLFLNLSSGLSSTSYGFADAELLPEGLLAPLAFTFQLASSGSFSVEAPSTVPEPNSLLLLFTGFLLLYLGPVMGRRLRAESSRIT